MKTDINELRISIANEWNELVAKLNAGIVKNEDVTWINEGDIITNADNIYPEMKNLQQLIMTLCALYADGTDVVSVLDKVKFTRFNPDEL